MAIKEGIVNKIKPLLAALAFAGTGLLAACADNPPQTTTTTTTEQSSQPVVPPPPLVPGTPGTVTTQTSSHSKSYPAAQP